MSNREIARLDNGVHLPVEIAELVGTDGELNRAGFARSKSDTSEILKLFHRTRGLRIAVVDIKLGVGAGYDRRKGHCRDNIRRCQSVGQARNHHSPLGRPDENDIQP